MRLTVDLDTLQLIESATDRRRKAMIELKRGDSTPLEVQFVRSGVAEEAVVTGATLTFALKEDGKFDGDFVVSFDDFAAPTATPNFLYAGTPSLNTVELDELLEKDGSDENDVAYVDLMGELSWTDSDGENPTSIRTFIARVHNDVIRGDENTPTAQPSPAVWLAANGIVYDPAIVGLTGGGATKLDGIATVGVAVGRLQAVSFSGTFYVYILTAGSLPEDGYAYVVPDDYNALTNAKYWRLASFGISSLDVGAAGAVTIQNYNGTGVANLDFSALTDTRDVLFQDVDGIVALLSGAQTFTGQITLSGQTAAAANSAMTRGLSDARYGRRPVILDQDVSKTSDTTPSNVGMASSANHPEGLSVFGFSLAANECLTFEAILQVTDASSPRNQRYGLSVPSGCTYQLGLTATGNAGSAATYAFGATDAVVNALSSATNGGMVHIRGTITNGSTAGNVAMTFYQSSSSANTITIKKGSALIVHRP